MNRLILIGNGFDLAHGLKTSYKDFIDWYWVNRIKGLEHEDALVSTDPLCTLTNALNKPWSESYLIDKNLRRREIAKIITYVKNSPYYYQLEMSKLLSTICKNIEIKGWADIENDYYSCLTYYVSNYKALGKDTIVGLNKEFAYLKERLIDYLNTESQKATVFIKSINDKIYENFRQCEIDITSSYYENNSLIEGTYPDNIMLLNFNYTSTPLQYVENKPNVTIKYIHGKLDNPQSVIFGYGDETDKDYERLNQFDDGECLRYIKQMHYNENSYYRDLMEFIKSAPFQICIMGHSCGKSDRTLLNMMFEHVNCVSIKPYYHVYKDGEDDYEKLFQNIDKSCTNKQLVRNKVVVKTNTKPLS